MKLIMYMSPTSGSSMASTRKSYRINPSGPMSGPG
jgi:hypothetical protein